MSIDLRVLLIEDSKEDAFLIERDLRRGGLSPRCTRVESAEAVTGMLKSESWDLIIADYSLPSFDGLAAFRILQETGLDIPFIIVSGSIGEDIAVRAMKSGIHDYVMKNNLTRLVPAIQRELREVEERRARRDAERKLKEAERLRVVGELTASLIHDLKNPLQSILASSELLARDTLDSAKRAKYCTVIDRQVQRVLAMSEEVLEFVRGRIHLTLEPVRLDTLVQELVETYTAAFHKVGVALVFSGCCPASSVPDVSCDQQRIWRTLQNLINNAKDAMPDGGKITVGVDCDADNVILNVSDTGNGIPETIRNRLFEPFVTHGKRHGTGLGLAIVKNIIDAHHGSISFESSTGRGTTFRIALPLRRAAGNAMLENEKVTSDVGGGLVNA